MMSELAYETIGESNASERLIIAHGIMGKGQNWRSLARTYVRGRDAVAFLLDLRCHGESRGFKPPHTIEACATDIVELAATLRPTRLMGHSFGGKVMILVASSLSSSIEELVLADAHPGIRPGRRGAEAVEVALEVLRLSEGQSFGTRGEFVGFAEEQGLSAGVARWLATNLEGRPFQMRLKYKEIKALLSSYSQTDLWQTLTSLGMHKRAIIGAETEVLITEDRERLRAIPNLGFYALEGAGHWLHVQAPKAFLRALADESFVAL